MKHVFAKVLTPPFVGILQVTGPVDKHHSRAVFLFGNVQTRIDFGTIGSFYGDDLRLLPSIRAKFRRK